MPVLRTARAALVAVLLTVAGLGAPSAAAQEPPAYLRLARSPASVGDADLIARGLVPTRPRYPRCIRELPPLHHPR